MARPTGPVSGSRLGRAAYSPSACLVRTDEDDHVGAARLPGSRSQRLGGVDAEGTPDHSRRRPVAASVGDHGLRSRWERVGRSRGAKAPAPEVSAHLTSEPGRGGGVEHAHADVRGDEPPGCRSLARRLLMLRPAVAEGDDRDDAENDKGRD